MYEVPRYEVCTMYNTSCVRTLYSHLVLVHSSTMYVFTTHHIPLYTWTMYIVPRTMYMYLVRGTWYLVHSTSTSHLYVYSTYLYEVSRTCMYYYVCGDVQKRIRCNLYEVIVLCINIIYTYICARGTVDLVYLLSTVQRGCCLLHRELSTWHEHTTCVRGTHICTMYLCT